MGNQPPFLYDAVQTEGPRSPYKEFDPRAATRASIQAARAPPRKKQEGPLVSFNQHPDSYLIVPYGKTKVKPMSPSVKKWIKWMRIIQLVLRCFEIISAAGLLVLMILIRNVDDVTGWIMRIVPGVAIFHTVYGIYHLGRKANGRTPGSSASYALFASFFDCSILPFYAFSALVAQTHTAVWTTVLANQDLVPIFTQVVYLLGIVGGGLHLVSLVISLYLAITFRKITKLPPDMNPLEDNLTSRHKRSKSSISTTTTASSKRISTPLESKRSSGAPYEDLSRPPTIPFFHTRAISTDSFDTYKSTVAPTSRQGTPQNARDSLPSSRRYPVPMQQNGYSSSPRSSVVDMKRASYLPSNPAPATPPKRASYKEVPTSEFQANANSNDNTKPTDPWYVSDSLSKSHTSSRTHAPPGKRAQTPSPRKQYAPLHQRHDSDDSTSTFTASQHPNPLNSNPATPTPPKHAGHRYNLSQNSPLSEITNNRAVAGRGDARRVSGDITNLSAGNGGKRLRNANDDDVSALSSYSDDEVENESALGAQFHADRIREIEREIEQERILEQQREQRRKEVEKEQEQREDERERALTPAPLRSSELAFKSKYYGELKPGTPPLIGGVGAGGGGRDLGERQVSTGTDWGMGMGLGMGMGAKKREVSGKVAEEGRAAGGGRLGARFRRVSGFGGGK